jgi:hypothetical protein
MKALSAVPIAVYAAYVTDELIFGAPERSMIARRRWSVTGGRPEIPPGAILSAQVVPRFMAGTRLTFVSSTGSPLQPSEGLGSPNPQPTKPMRSWHLIQDLHSGASKISERTLSGPGAYDHRMGDPFTCLMTVETRGNFPTDGVERSRHVRHCSLVVFDQHACLPAII